MLDKPTVTNTLFVKRGLFRGYKVYQRQPLQRYTLNRWVATFRRAEDADLYVQERGIRIHEYPKR
jgi:hypothetical protein